MSLVQVNLVPRLKCILDGHYDPKGGLVKSDKMIPGTSSHELVMKPWDKEHQPTGYVSLSAADFECFQLLCRKVRYEYDKEAVQEVGGGGAQILIKDLAGVFVKTTPETEVTVAVQVAE